MIKNRTVQLMLQTSFCTLGIFGILASFGIFNYSFKSDFYLYFTNLSNYLCIFIMFCELCETVKKKKNSFVTKMPLLKFIGLLSILLTFVLFNFMLAKDREPYMNFQIQSVLFHIVLPIMYMLDWLLFYEKGKIKKMYPFYSTLFPCSYVVFVFIRAFFLNFDATIENIYPYFFFNIDKLGVSGVLIWLAILFVAFVVVGYIILGIDKMLKKKN